ncbi:hypothetical protein CS542_09705 [Pedobacter sp. IW39]|nr:hypothetical protein CS542_09705 [Pedobacter sp. IW39]
MVFNVITWIILTVSDGQEREYQNLKIRVLQQYSNGEQGTKKMEMGMGHAGKTFIDVLGYRKKKTIDENGWAEFCRSRVLVWITKGI